MLLVDIHAPVLKIHQLRGHLNQGGYALGVDGNGTRLRGRHACWWGLMGLLEGVLEGVLEGGLMSLIKGVLENV